MQTEEENQMQDAFNKAKAEAQAQAQDEQVEQETATEQTEAQEQEPVELNVDEIKALYEENVKLKAQLQEAEEKYKADTEKLVRSLAEVQNQKRRMENDVENERKYGNEKLLKALLPVVDALELAIQHVNPEDEATKNILEGVKNTDTLFLAELKKFGVEQIDPMGQPFDPNFHQAISMVPSAEVPENHVLGVMQKGYTLNGRVTRAAMVMVSRGAPEAKPEDEKKSINIEA